MRMYASEIDDGHNYYISQNLSAINLDKFEFQSLNFKNFKTIIRNSIY
jgi:hypothetical protein